MYGFVGGQVYMKSLNDSYIINKNNRIIARIKANSEAYLIGKTLYTTLDNKLFEIDLSEMLVE